jgi:hypothetical protein
MSKLNKTSNKLVKMLKKSALLLFLGITFLISCTNNTDNQIVGKWADNIVLSQKSAALNSAMNSITITTKYNGWWLDGIGLDNKNTDLTGINRFSQNFIVTNSDFQVERKNGNTIIITMNQNTTNSERILYVSLQGGDYFDGIKVIQSK